MEINGFVDYTKIYPIEIEDPKTGAKLGIKVNLRSAGSPTAKAVLKDQQRDRLERIQRGKLITDMDKIESQELERVCSCVDSWDWGENTYEGDTPKSDMRTYLRILSKENWMFAQVKEGAEEIGNFMRSSDAVSAPP